MRRCMQGNKSYDKIYGEEKWLSVISLFFVKNIIPLRVGNEKLPPKNFFLEKFKLKTIVINDFKCNFVFGLCRSVW